MAATGFTTMHVRRVYAVAGPAYGGAVLAIYTHVGVLGERTLGVLTWLVLLCALWPLPALARAQALGVVAVATVGEVAGSIVWGIYHYRSHDLPLFVPPGRGLVYLTGLAVARIVGERRIVWAAAVGAVGWGLAGLTLLPRLDVAGGLGVAVVGAVLWRSRAPRTPASSSSSPPLSCMAPRSGPGTGRGRCRASGSPTATHRAARRAAMSGST
jgi:hypothetical protein